MKTKSQHSLGWKHVYILLISLILTALLLRNSRKSPSDSTLLSDQDQLAESSSVLSAPYQLTVSSTLSPVPDQLTESSPAPDSPEITPENGSVSGNPDGNFEQTDSQSVTTEESENTVESVDPPINIATSYPPERADSISSSSTTEVCNYAKGRWVVDSRRPFYSGFACKRWLPKSWACRLTQRTDFSYEGYRWQPFDCEIPEFDRFSFLRKMQNKTIAFIGDSLGRQQFHSLMCMATGGEDSPEVEDVGREYGLVKRPEAIRPDGWAYRFPSTNTTILFHWSLTLCRFERISSEPFRFAMHLDQPPTFVKKFLNRFDVLVLNTAHHWIKQKFIVNGWEMYMNGKPIMDGILMDMTNVKNFTVHRVVKWLDSQIPLHPQLKAFFRTRSPRHFVDGDSSNGGSCNNTTPLTIGNEVLQDGSTDKVVESAVWGTRVKILDISALSKLRDEAHKAQYTVFGNSAFYDCLHWCLPGIPDTWNELLAAQL